jgi:hypothetical protein
MTKRKLYSKVGWRKYLDPTGRPRVKRFIETNGNVVFNQVVECIKNASIDNQSEIMVLVHPNVSAVVVIEENDYDEVLTHCLQYFQSKEKYEECGNIIKLKKEIKKTTETVVS